MKKENKKLAINVERDCGVIIEILTDDETSRYRMVG